jgi:hypothetical protein
MKHLSVFSRSLLVVLIVISYDAVAFMNTQHDPYPLASALYPCSFLTTGYKENRKNSHSDINEETTHLSFAPFAQRALSATDYQKNDLTNLGDLHGRWSMIGLLYGSIPQGQTQPALLTDAAAQKYQDPHTLNYVNYRDIGNQLGFFSVPLTYRKAGIRFEWQWRFLNSFVLALQGGFADIKQTRGTLSDQSSSASTISDIYGNTAGITDLKQDISTVQEFLTDPAQQIFDQLGYNTSTFNKSGAEDLFVSVTWREPFFFNTGKNRKAEWSSFSIMPFITLKGSFGFGDKKDPAKLFALPFGNNGHHAIQLVSGLSFDFNETLELSARIGGTHYFKRDIAKMFVPTSKAQSGIFPYATSVNYEPGKTWFFTVGCNSHHFLDKLSMYAEYYFVQHEKDSIKLITPDTAFIPSVLEDTTLFNVQGINLAMSYDLSPNISFGGVWQFPVVARNAYKTNTITLNFLITL